MAASIVPRVSACEQVTRALGLPEVQALIEHLEATRWTGRPGYSVRAMIGMCLIKAVYALPTWSRTAALVAEHDGLRRTLGDAPSVYACYRFCEKLRRHAGLLDECVAAVIADVRRRQPELGRHVAIDGSDVQAWANGQRYVRKGGPERERYSDPDASWGHRSAVSTRGHGGFYGYKLHLAVCAATGLPLAWEIRTARENESTVAMPLLDRLIARGAQPETAAMDKGYDLTPVYEGCEARGCHPVIPLRKSKGGGEARQRPAIDRDSDQFSRLYRGRSAVEREFGRLKHEWGLATLRVRGLARVALHATLTILARLCVALVAARGV